MAGGTRADEEQRAGGKAPEPCTTQSESARSGDEPLPPFDVLLPGLGKNAARQARGRLVAVAEPKSAAEDENTTAGRAAAGGRHGAAA